ncbi:MAG: winged helix-turn-helix transcriptional regulator [Formosimonas sp.]
MLHINRSQDCNINQCELSSGMEQLKSRWMAGIILSLQDANKRFSELEANFPFMSAGQLNRTLRQAMDNHMVVKEESLYQLTTKGQEAAHLYLAIEQWVMKFDG